VVVGASPKPVETVDESATGSANFMVPHGETRSRTL
jgi:hypothetical protein